ncbi:hypothetical protein SeLEV6574_g03240 [Synchytrium endobioticum]|nr:hypothetical protein SeLEV6574_g03240 [Synchytrium endobioticum]
MPADRPKRTRSRTSVLSPDPTPTPPPLEDETIAFLNITTTPYEEPAPTPHARPPVVFSQPDNPDMCALEAAEYEIDWAVLHPTESATRERKGAAAFKRSVIGLQKIVSEKLYRVMAASVQSYFKNRFELTRAQAYRFIDCAVVLDHLTGLKHPTRERLCRCLKKVCTSRQDMRSVWLKALAERQNDPERVNSSLIEVIAAELKHDREGKPGVKTELGVTGSVPRVNGALRKKSTKPASSSTATIMGIDGIDHGLLRVKDEPNTINSTAGSAPQSIQGIPDPFVNGASDEVAATEEYDDSLTSSSEEEIDTDDSDVYVPKYQLAAASRNASQSQRVGTRYGGRRTVARSSEVPNAEPSKRRGGSTNSVASSHRSGRAAKKAPSNVKKESKLPSRPDTSSKPTINMEEIVRQEGESAASILHQFGQFGFELQPRLGDAWRGGVTEWRVSTISNPPPGCIAIDDQGDIMAWEGASDAELERIMQELVNSNDADETAMLLAIDSAVSAAQEYPQITMNQQPSTTLPATDTSPYQQATAAPPAMSIPCTQPPSTMSPNWQQAVPQHQGQQQQLQQTSMAPPSKSVSAQPPPQPAQPTMLPTPPPTNAKPSPNRMMTSYPLRNDEFAMSDSNNNMPNTTGGGTSDFLFNDVFGSTFSGLSSSNNPPDQDP